MTGFHVHIDLPLDYSLIMAHTEMGADYPVRSEVIYPQEKISGGGGKLSGEAGCPPPEPALARSEQGWPMPHFNYAQHQPGEHEFVFWGTGLVFIEREEGQIVIEPESANWMILTGPYAALFKEMKRPIPYGYILCNAFLARAEAGKFISFCLAHNFLRLENCLTLYEPLAVTPFESPDTFILELSRVSEGGEGRQEDVKKCAPEVLVSVVDELFGKMAAGWKMAAGMARLELHSATPEEDRHAIAECMALVEKAQQKEFRDLGILLHVPAGKLERSYAAFLAWHGIKVRLHLDLIRKNEEGAAKDLRTAREAGILESLSVTIDDPSDFPLLERLITLEQVSRTMVVIASPSTASCVPPADFPRIMAHNLLTLGENCQVYAGADGSLRVPIIEPLSLMVNNLVSSRRCPPCFAENQHPMSSRLYIDVEGMVFPCEGCAHEKASSDPPHRDEGWYRCQRNLGGRLYDCHRCDHSLKSCHGQEKECTSCPFRNICPGICPAAPAVSWKESCRIYRILIPELMARINRGRERW
jgi:hypothetical protein